MDRFDKCRFCWHYDGFDGCTLVDCNYFTRDKFVPNKQKIIEEAKKSNLSVSDIIALIQLK